MKAIGQPIEIRYLFSELPGACGINKNILYKLKNAGYLKPERAGTAEFYTKSCFDKAMRLSTEAYYEQQSTVVDAKVQKPQQRGKRVKGNSARERGKERNAILRQQEKEMRERQRLEMTKMGNPFDAQGQIKTTKEEKSKSVVTNKGKVRLQ